ncbi:MAG: hypothetical protein JO283_17030 [Bradyrhizobium sp.]|nr:hypothetical protein [Bradyrhizobium sp.]
MAPMLCAQGCSEITETIFQKSLHATLRCTKRRSLPQSDANWQKEHEVEKWREDHARQQRGAG